MIRAGFRLEGDKALYRAIRAMRDQVLGELRPFIVREAMNLLQQAERMEPRATGELSNSKAIIPLRERNGLIEVAAAYTSEKSAPVHEGIFGYAKLGGGYAHYKWFERALEAEEQNFAERARQALLSALSKHTSK